MNTSTGTSTDTSTSADASAPETSRASAVSPGAGEPTPPSAPVYPPGWVRALLPLGILCTLEETGRHGYAIAHSLGTLGFGIPRGGSLYPALTRLEESGEITARWAPGPSGPARKVYDLTDRGRERLRTERALLQRLREELGA